MRQWQFPAFGIDSLALVEKDSRPLEPGLVRVCIRAVSLNHRDLLMVKGVYNPRLAMPRVPCSDGAGEVSSVAPDVTQWKPGDRVAGIFMQNWLDGPPSAAKSKDALGGDIDGVLATEVQLPATSLVRIPDHLSYEQAATLPCAGVTAWNALFRAADTRPGDTVLIQGTGGVSIFALQFAKTAGARVLGISSSDAKLERARALGLDAGLNYKTNPDWDKWAFEQTGGAGVDLVVEVGGSGTLPRAIRAIRPGGTIAQIGVLSGAAEIVDLRSILSRQVRIQGIFVGSKVNFEEMNKAIAQANLIPVLDSVFSFHDAQAAFRQMEGATHFGKIVISVE